MEKIMYPLWKLAADDQQAFCRRLLGPVAAGLREAGAGEVPVVVGGIIPESDAATLRAQGVAAVFTPKDFGLNDIMGRFVEIIRESRGLAPLVSEPA